MIFQEAFKANDGFRIYSFSNEEVKLIDVNSIIFLSSYVKHEHKFITILTPKGNPNKPILFVSIN